MPDVPKIVILVGLPGAGKTRYAEQLFLNEMPQAYVVSSDDIRAIFSDVYKKSVERFVWEVVEALCRGCLHAGRSVILDATNLTKLYRAGPIWWAREVGGRVECHYVKTTPAESVRRSAKWIKKAEIEAMASKLEEPEETEGFDRLVVIDETKPKRRRFW